MITTKRTLLSLAILTVASASQASDDLFGDASGDDLFGGNNSFITDDVDNSTNLADGLLTNDAGIVWSGSFQWDAQLSKADHEQLPEDAQLSSAITGNLKLDARPDADYRALINVDYSINEDAADFVVREGFADFSVEDIAFVRAGQQTLSWGVGYFFSPVDTLSADPLNASDPDADRIGTAAVRVHVPIETSNFYAYALPDEALDTFTIAGKAEWLIAGNEMSIGAVRHANEEWNIASTLSVPTDVGDFFAEYNGVYGETSLAVDEVGNVTDRTNEFLHQATVGFNIVEDLGEVASAQVSAQYFYNGQGYDHTLRTDDPTAWSQLSSNNELSALPGQHYGAGMISLSDIAGKDVSISTLALTDLTDGSIMVSPSLTWTPLDTVALSVGSTHLIGETGSTYAAMGDLNQVEFTVTLAKGSF